MRGSPHIFLDAMRQDCFLFSSGGESRTSAEAGAEVQQNARQKHNRKFIVTILTLSQLFADVRHRSQSFVMDSARSKENAIAFLTAHFAGDADTALALCASEFESVVFAPVELFPHLGQKKGRGWVDESIRLQARRYSARRFEILSALGDGDEAVLIVRIHLTKRSDRRVIEFLSMHAFVFENGLIVRHREMFDSFHMVEQLLGVDLTREFADRIGRAV